MDEKAYRMKQAALWCCKAKDYDRQWKHVFCELPTQLGVEQTLADQLIRVEGEKGQKGKRNKGRGKGRRN